MLVIGFRMGVNAGHYVVLTLFLAVILEAFESAYDEDTEAEVIVADVVTRAALQGETPLKSALVKPKSFKVSCRWHMH